MEHDVKNKTLSIIVLALGLTSAGISVTQAQGNMKNNNGGMMHGGMMHGGMMYSQLNLTKAPVHSKYHLHLQQVTLLSYFLLSQFEY